MNKTLKFAFCTDFSVASHNAVKIAVLAIEFFPYDVDIVHLVEDDEEKETKYLEKYVNELRIFSKGRHLINSRLFRKGDIGALKEYLINGDCTNIVMGVTGLGNNQFWGSFTKSIYPDLNKDLVIIPFDQVQFINNKVLIGVELKNLEQLYLIKKYRVYFKARNAEVRIVVLTENNIEDEILAEAREKIVEVLPNVKLNISFDNPEEVAESLEKEVKSETFDILFYFGDDFFDGFVSTCFNEHPLKDRAVITVNKVASSPELIKKVKAVSSYQPSLS